MNRVTMRSFSFLNKKVACLFVVVVSSLCIGYYAEKHFSYLQHVMLPSTYIIENSMELNLRSFMFEPHKIKETVKVLLLTYGRSGSSYIGQLISSIPNSMYYFEPSLPLHRTHNLTTDTLLTLIQGLFYCEPPSYKYIRYKNSIAKRLGQQATVPNCMNADIILMKTIRLRLEPCFDWLSRHSNVKVIYLVRDPRGIYASTPSGWGSAKNPAIFCKEMESDLLLFHGMLKNRAMLLKFEDVVKDPLKEAHNVMDFLLLPWQQEVESYINRHYSSQMNTGNYHGLYQPKEFSPSHKWEKLPNQSIAYVEHYCKNYMISLNYPLREQ